MIASVHFCAEGPQHIAGIHVPLYAFFAVGRGGQARRSFALPPAPGKQGAWGAASRGLPSVVMRMLGVAPRDS